GQLTFIAPFKLPYGNGLGAAPSSPLGPAAIPPTTLESVLHRPLVTAVASRAPSGVSPDRCCGRSRDSLQVFDCLEPMSLIPTMYPSVFLPQIICGNCNVFMRWRKHPIGRISWVCPIGPIFKPTEQNDILVMGTGGSVNTGDSHPVKSFRY